MASLSPAKTIDIPIEFDAFDFRYRIEWKTASRWRNVRGIGDETTVVTQCNITANGFVVGTAHVTKDSRDKIDTVLAMRLSAAKALGKVEIMGHTGRSMFWKRFFEKYQPELAGHIKSEN